MISRRNLFKRVAGAGAAIVALPFLSRSEEVYDESAIDLSQAALENTIVSWDNSPAVFGRIEAHERLWPGLKQAWDEAFSEFEPDG